MQQNMTGQILTFTGKDMQDINAKESGKLIYIIGWIIYS